MKNFKNIFCLKISSVYRMLFKFLFLLSLEDNCHVGHVNIEEDLTCSLDNKTNNSEIDRYYTDLV